MLPHSRSYHIVKLSEAAYNLPLPKTKVLAHIAGPSGSGKTELANRLSAVAHNIHFVDLDEFDDEAVSSLGWTHVPKNDYTDEMLHKLFVLRQKRITNFIKQSYLPIVFFGHHIEAGYVTKIPTSVRILLNVSPRSATIRRAKRFDYSKERVQQDIEVGKEDVRFLRAHGYILMSPRQVYSIIMRWSQELG